MVLFEKTKELNGENKKLQQQLQEAKEYIDTIREEKIDAFVIPNKKGIKVYSEKTADKTYRVLIEKMHEGAVTLSRDGIILYSNSSFANMVNLPLQKVTGVKFKKFIDYSSKEHFEALFKLGWKGYSKDEIDIYSNDGKVIPALMSVNTLLLDTDFILGVIITDLTIQNKNQEELKRQARQLERKNFELENANIELHLQEEEKKKRLAALSIDKDVTLSKTEKKINIRQRLLLFSIIILLGNGFIGYALYRYNQKHSDSEKIVNQAEQVIQLSGKLLSLVKDIEIASQGYVITKDNKFLEPLFTAKKTIFQYIGELRQLSLDNSARQQRIDSLNLYSQKCLDLSIHTVELRNKQGLSAAISAVSTGQSKLYTSRIRMITGDILLEEAAILKQQMLINAGSVAALGWFTLVMFVLMLVFTILLVIFGRNYFYQNKEIEKQAAKLTIANKELAIQNEEKEKREAELTIVNKDLTTFSFVTSHDLQEPLRKIKNFISVLLEEEENKLSDDGKNYMNRMYETANGMQVFIEDLLKYARAKGGERKFEKTDLNIMVEEVKKDFEEVIHKKKAIIEVTRLCEVGIIRVQFRQLIQNLIDNSLKFLKEDSVPKIIIKSEIVNGSNLNIAHLNDKVGQEKLSSKIDYCHIIYNDNGISFDPRYNERIFDAFQRLHSKEEYEGTGIGLAICKRIVENHNGFITATGELNKGTQFDIYIPVIQKK